LRLGIGIYRDKDRVELQKTLTEEKIATEIGQMNLVHQVTKRVFSRKKQKFYGIIEANNTKRTKS
jgi:hypothetical protein